MFHRLLQHMNVPIRFLYRLMLCSLSPSLPSVSKVYIPIYLINFFYTFNYIPSIIYGSIFLFYTYCKLKYIYSIYSVYIVVIKNIYCSNYNISRYVHSLPSLYTSIALSFLYLLHLKSSLIHICISATTHCFPLKCVASAISCGIHIVVTT